MGADIHTYVEFSTCSTGPGPDGPPYWQPLGGQIRLDRQYSLFGRIADVRQTGAIIPPRGLPDDLAYEAEGDSLLRIVEDDDKRVNEEGCVARSRALEWVQQGERIIDRGSVSYVTHPDWHSHTWFTPSEWRQVLQAQEEAAARDPDQCSSPGVGYYAVAAALESLEASGAEARIVVWFDN